jgi:hypothetical protein
MTSDSGSFMVVFLILILIFALFITYLILNAKKTSESYTNYDAYKPFRGRAPNAPPGCCGNLDWYLGTEGYDKYCGANGGGSNGGGSNGGGCSAGGNVADNVSGNGASDNNNNLHEYFGNLQENVSGFQRQADECKQKGLKAAYNPTVCTDEGDTYEPSANCKCVDEKNNCKECYGKINF